MSGARAPASWRPIGLVARREMRERLRSKGFRIAFVVVVAAVVALTAAPAFLDPTSTSTVGVVEPVPQGFDDALGAVADGEEVTTTGFPDAAAGEQALRDGDVDVLWDTSADQLVWESSVDPTLDAQVRAAAGQAGFDQAVGELGLDAQDRQQLLASSRLEERTLEPDDDETTRVALALGGTIVLFVAISTYGGYVLTGVVNEKTSRIAEVLLSQVRASQLLAGKVLGIGTLALAQVVAVAAAVLITGQLADTVDVPSVGTAVVVSTIGFFVLGFAIYATLYAAAGALVNRQEDTQAVSFPVVLPLLAGYIVAASTVTDPDNPVGIVLSLFPLTAPVQMPLRIQVGDVPAWQVAASVLICLAFIAVTISIAGRVYAGALLRTGSRVRVRDALRAADDVRA